MSDELRSTGELSRASGEIDEARLATLLDRAGRRPEIPADDLSAITAAARAEWRRRYVAERPLSGRARPWLPLAAAAALAGITTLVALVAIRSRGVDPGGDLAPARAIATVERLIGEGVAAVVVDGRREPLAAVGERRELAAGSLLETDAKARIALALAGGESLRLDAGSRVRLLSATAVELVAGRLYVDDGAASGGALDVHSAVGSVRPVGTQYEVRLDEVAGAATLRLRVREGSVALARDGEAVAIAAAGEEVSAGAHGAVARRSLASEPEPWSWAIAAAPSIPIEGRTAGAVLVAFAREQGWRVEPLSSEVATIAADCVLRGSVASLAPDEALAVALAGCDLVVTRAGDALRVGLAAEAR